jgi:hypothetical protein
MHLTADWLPKPRKKTGVTRTFCGQSSEGLRGTPEIVRMVVPIDVFQGFAAHPEETRGLPHRNAALHEPRRACVPQDMRTYPLKPGTPTRRGKASLHIAEALAVLADHESERRAAFAGAPEMPQ